MFGIYRYKGLYSQTNHPKPMKRSTITKVLFIGLLLPVLFFTGGCNKEAAVKKIAQVTVNSNDVDSSNYFKGYFDGQPVKFEGKALAYNAFVDPDSAGNGGGNYDHDAYYQSGSKWVTLNNAGIQVINASVELRSLAVRVFVSPSVPVADVFYNLLNPAYYPVSDNSNNLNDGAFVSIRDAGGVLWTTKGDQDGSVLTITGRGANMNTYTEVSGTITAKMYDAEGNMKKLTNASFTAALGI